MLSEGFTFQTANAEKSYPEFFKFQRKVVLDIYTIACIKIGGDFLDTAFLWSFHC